MPDSLLWWILGAVALFWFIGAYNRIVRLRSGALQAYATLDLTLVRQLEFVQARLAEELVPVEAASGTAREDAGLKASTAQLVTLLVATRLKPLDPARITALAAALHAMLSAWERLHPDAVISFEADGTLSRPAPLNGRHEGAPVPMAWPEPSAAAEIARSQFNQAVEQYNAAIVQFPALLVAWIMQLRPAAPLR
ncbi:LemA family protein [Variovorax sp. PBL-H6]|uniref:LemA family protein n=1 Tax=Variovorax sp. PBL-H6 TaxID=434009 RepID=UPI0013194BE4|nr:LemA family protein [Variovorax sp. PBL-H6]VTU37678.1 LemA family protein [Variovorax sp. PBL-H6]